MALIEMKFVSQVLGVPTKLTVILPESDYTHKIDYTKEFKFQTVYLLHGGVGDGSDWIRKTSIELYAQENMVAVVMPDVDLSYYTDMAHGKKYFTFISEELPLIARRYFPLSEKREDNFVAGLSMGGYGSFKWALRKPEMFAAAASFSGTLDMANLLSKIMPQLQPIRKLQFDDIFGDYDNMAEGDEDLLHIAEVAKESKVELPRLFQCCGTEDFTYDLNTNFRDHAKSLGIDLHFEDGPGTHAWDYWDTNLKKALEWFKTKKNPIYK